jgi:hypothetical protein
MPRKQLKPSTGGPQRPDSSGHGTSGVTASELRRVARDSARSLPPAAVRSTRQTVLINIKVSTELADALAERARADGLTQKQVICRALADIGLPVDALDLADRSPQRRRRAPGGAPLR